MAPFIDAFLIGDASEALPTALHAIAASKGEGLPRAEQLRLAVASAGLVCAGALHDDPDDRTGCGSSSLDPGTGQPYPIKRTIVSDLKKFPFPDESPTGGPEAIFDRMSIEVARGCTEGCRFCQAGMIYRPVRERDPKEVVSTVERALQKSGQDEVS
jgi:radical SAM superfamily enzyme YgiQ (UPF0313 family)